MHEDSILDGDAGSSGILRRGVFVYYVGSLFFIAGIALSALGVAFIMIFKLHYGSTLEEILIIVTFIGVGIILVLTGIIWMLKQKK